MADGCDSSFAPLGLVRLRLSYPRLTPWAVLCRRFAAILCPRFADILCPRLAPILCSGFAAILCSGFAAILCSGFAAILCRGFAAIHGGLEPQGGARIQPTAQAVGKKWRRTSPSRGERS